ncbi:hypothetical protein D3C77_566760 [compost metagenome]
MKQLPALGITIVKHIVVGQLAEKLIIEVEACSQVVVIVERNVEQGHAGLFGLFYRSKDVIALKGDVVHTRAAIVR